MSESKSLVVKFADRYSVDSGKLLATLSSTAFKQRDGSAPTNEQMMALLVVADQYKLNPFTKEIYAFPDKQNGITPVVGVDGWSRIINSDPMFDGMDFKFSEDVVQFEGMKHPASAWCECTMYRKDRSHPVVVREYLQEVYRPPFKGKYGLVEGPWQTHTMRFLRHKTMIQCARLAFGFVGIYDQDEAEHINEQQVRDMGNAVVVEHELPPIDDAKLKQTIEAIKAGMTDAETAVDMLSSKYKLADIQIEALKKAEQNTEITEAEIIEGEPA